MRRLFAEINFDEEVASRNAETNGYDDDGPTSTVEREFGWLEQSGITLANTVLADADDSDLWSRYLYYLMGWAMRHTYDDEPESPLSWEQYKKREECGPIALVGPRFARTLIEDLGSGEPTPNGERTSAYHEVASGRGTTAGRTCKMALIERTVGYEQDKDYYELHVINDIDMSGCKLLYTEHLSETELYALLKTTLDRLERGEEL